MKSRMAATVYFCAGCIAALAISFRLAAQTQQRPAQYVVIALSTLGGTDAAAQQSTAAA